MGLNQSVFMAENEFIDMTRVKQEAQIVEDDSYELVAAQVDYEPEILAEAILEDEQEDVKEEQEEDIETDPSYKPDKEYSTRNINKKPKKKLIQTVKLKKEKKYSDPTDDFVCTSCQMTFTKSCRLIKHLKEVHNDTFPYKCQDCGKGYKTTDGRSNHWAIVR